MVKLFTHNDLDGVGCAVLALLAFGDYADITYCDYGDINEKVKKFADENIDHHYWCCITDISVCEELAKEIDEKYDNYCLLDHHATSLNLNQYSWCTVKVYDEKTKLKTSGTELFYHWLINNGYLAPAEVIEVFVRIVRDYDTWNWTTLGEKGIICKQINDLCYLYGKTQFITWCMTQIWGEIFPTLGDKEKLILRIKQQEIDDYVIAKDKTLIVGSLCGYTCGFVFAEKYFSELGNRLCELNPELDLVAMIHIDGTISYRTIKDIDLGKEIAAKFGGGGHPKAAGSQFSQDIKFRVIGQLFGGQVEIIVPKEGKK